MKTILFIAFFLCIASMVIAQTDLSQKKPAISATPSDSASMAKIYVIRSTGHLGSAVNFRLLVDDAMQCKIHNKRYAILYVQPGTRVFHMTSWDKPNPKKKLGLSIPVEAGKNYYLTMRIKQRFAEVEFFLEEITYNSAAPQLEKLKKDDCD